MSLVLDRQGDLLFWHKKDFKIPKNVKLKPAKLIHSGNNNDHFISKGIATSSEWFEENGVQKMYLRISKDSIVSHGGGRSKESKSERHKDTKLDVRDYWVEIQSEFDHVKKLKRAVID